MLHLPRRSARAVNAEFAWRRWKARNKEMIAGNASGQSLKNYCVKCSIAVGYAVIEKKKKSNSFLPGASKFGPAPRIKQCSMSSCRSPASVWKCK